MGLGMGSMTDCRWHERLYCGDGKVLKLEFDSQYPSYRNHLDALQVMNGLRKCGECMK
jgi:hypothetical protein